MGREIKPVDLFNEMDALNITTKSLETAVGDMNKKLDVAIGTMHTFKQKEKRQMSRSIDTRLKQANIRLDALPLGRKYVKEVLLPNGKYENITLDSDLALMTDEGRVKTEMYIIDIIQQCKVVNPQWFL